MDVMKKIDESCNDRRVKFVALNLQIYHQSEINRLLIITMSIIVWPFWRYKWQNYWHQKCRRLHYSGALPPRTGCFANKPLPMRRDLPPERPHVPAWKVSENTERIVQRPVEPLPYIQHTAIEPQHVNLQSQPSENTEWRTQQKKRRPAQYGKRKDDGLAFKAVPRRQECVVFNTPQGCTTDTVKSYIVDNGVWMFWI